MPGYTHVYRVFLSSGKIGFLDRSYLLVGDEMEAV